MTVLVFGCSAAVLVLEILAGRLLAPYVGVSLETYTGIIGTVLAGIAIGSSVGGRAADHYDPKRLLGPTVFAGGVLSILAVPIVTALGPVMATDDRRLAILVLALTAFVAPTAVLSAVNPIAAKLRLSSTAETGTVVGGLSAAGTSGALVGTFLTGFVLVAAWPSRPIVIAVGIALIATGVALTWWARAMPDGGRARGGATAATVVVMGLAAVSPSPCELETAYFCASIEEDGGRASGRVLLLDDLRHSYVDLDDPTHLEFRYERLFARVVDDVAPDNGAAHEFRALHIGGGGFTFPRYLLATRPDSTQRVLELDPDVVRLGERQLGLDRGDPRLRIDVGDARTNIRGVPSAAFDLAVGDAFASLSVPWHLTTVEFLREVERVLEPGGTYVVNLIDGGEIRFVRAAVASLLEVFDHAAVITPPDGDYGNYVVVARDGPLSIDDPPRDLGRLITDRDELDEFVGRAKVLTDDHAPVDQLIARTAR